MDATATLLSARVPGGPSFVTALAAPTTIGATTAALAPAAAVAATVATSLTATA